jgi:hypothetical protein
MAAERVTVLGRGVMLVNVVRFDMVVAYRWNRQGKEKCYCMWMEGVEQSTEEAREGRCLCSVRADHMQAEAIGCM